MQRQVLVVGVLLGIVSVCFVAGDLQTDLQTFLPLIPRRRIGFIAAQHYIADADFRKAWTYVKGAEFPQTWQKLRDSAEIDEILAYVSREVDISALVDSIPNQLRSFKMPMKMPPDEALTQRNLASFLRDVIRALPRGSVSALMARKVREDGDFGKLYHVLRSAQFKELVHKARHSENLKSLVEEFSKHAIDIDALIKTGYTLLRWGP